MSEGGDKTEAPTAKRKQKAAEDGNILKSKDFATALVVMAGVAWLIFAGPSLIAACKAVMAASFQFDRADVEDGLQSQRSQQRRFLQLSSSWLHRVRAYRRFVHAANVLRNCRSGYVSTGLMNPPTPC